jgi:hypothetical protein
MSLEDNQKKKKKEEIRNFFKRERPADFATLFEPLLGENRYHTGWSIWGQEKPSGQKPSSFHPSHTKITPFYFFLFFDNLFFFLSL